MTGGGVGKLGTSCAMGGSAHAGCQPVPSVIQHGVDSALATRLAVRLPEQQWWPWGHWLGVTSFLTGDLLCR